MVPIVGEVALGLTAVSVAALAAYEALELIANSLLREFEELSPALASARAQQEAELAIYRQQVAPGGGAEIINAQTAVEKELIDIKAHLVEVLGPTIIYLAKIVTTILKVIDLGIQVLIWIQWFALWSWNQLLNLLSPLEHLPFIGKYIKDVRDVAKKALDSLDDDSQGKKDPFMQEAENFLDNMVTNRKPNVRPASQSNIRRPKVPSRRHRHQAP